MTSSGICDAWVAVALIFKRITSERYHYPIGRVAREKVAYFATEAGLPTGLTFERRPGGPYAERSKRMFAALMNDGLLEERKSGQRFITTPGPALCHAEERFSRELSRWEPAVERVADLFLRLPSAREAESVATVHYIADQLDERERNRGVLTTVSEVVDRVKNWKSRSRDEEITGAIQTLAFLGWIEGRLLKEAVEFDIARSAKELQVAN